MRDQEIALSELISNGLSGLKVQDEVSNGKLSTGLLQLSNNVRIIKLQIRNQCD